MEGAVTLASPQVLAPSNYTLKDIDEQLTFISNIIRHGSRRERLTCFAKADEWLDKRLEVTKSAD
jgi:ethanolamine utilization cobalamin adenosyltransferase